MKMGGVMATILNNDDVDFIEFYKRLNFGNIAADATNNYEAVKPCIGDTCDSICECIYKSQDLCYGDRSC